MATKVANGTSYKDGMDGTTMVSYVLSVQRDGSVVWMTKTVESVRRVGSMEKERRRDGVE